MSKKKGLLHTCDRCGVTQFTPFITSDTQGKKEPTGREHFHGEEYAAAEGWGYAADVGELCPKCEALYKEMIEKFRQTEEPVQVTLDTTALCETVPMTLEEITEREEKRRGCCEP